VGRQREMAALEAALTKAMLGQGQIVMLAGEPGIGKTRIAQELASHASNLGAQIFWGWCYEQEGAPPYWPWVQPIRSYVQRTDAELLGANMGPGAADICEIIPEVREKLPDLELPSRLEPEQARFRLFDSVATFLRNLAQSQSLVLVLDDLQWADQPSLLLLEFLARQMLDSRIMLVGTYRDVEVTRSHPLSNTLAQLARSEAYYREELEGLESEHVSQLIRDVSGAEPSKELVQAIYGHTEGNPFFMTEVIRLLWERRQATGEPAAEGISGLEIPQSVLEVIGQRLNRLSQECQGALTTAAVIGRQFDFRLLGILSEEFSEFQLLELIDEALGAYLIQEVPSQDDVYQFSHALVQQTLRERLSTSRRVRLHARIGETLETLYGDQLGDHAAELAFHFAEAVPVLGLGKLVKYSLLAGEQSLATYAYEEALGHFQRALTAKEKQPTDAEMAAALFGLGRAQTATLQRHELREAHLNLSRAFDYYASVGDTARFVAIAEIPFPILGEHSLQFGRLAVRALELVPEDSLEAGRLHSFHGNVQGMADGDYQSARGSFDRALAIARREGNAALEMRTLNFAAQVETWHHHFEDSLKSSLMAIDLAVAASDPRGEVTARYWASLCSRTLGDMQEMMRQAVAILEPAERLRDRYWLATAYTSVSWLETLQGDWESAREMNQRGLDVMPMDPRPLLQRVCLEIQFGDQNQVGLHLERLEEVVRQSEAGPNTANACLAFVSPQARSILDASKRANAGESSITAVLSSPVATPFFSTWARIGASLLAVLDDDSEAAGEHYAHLNLLAGVMYHDVNVDRVLGLLAGTMGDRDAAAVHFEDAAHFCRKAGYRPELAWACHDYADALLLRDRSGDHQKAKSLLEESLSISTELGMRPLMERVAALQERTDAQPVPAPADPDGLSHREVEVLRLIAAGKSNWEIAEELFISPNTAGHHVSNILNKTGSSNRAELATYAARHDLAS